VLRGALHRYRPVATRPGIRRQAGSFRATDLDPRGEAGGNDLSLVGAAGTGQPRPEVHRAIQPRRADAGGSARPPDPGVLLDLPHHRGRLCQTRPPHARAAAQSEDHHFHRGVDAVQSPPRRRVLLGRANQAQVPVGLDGGQPRLAAAAGGCGAGPAGSTAKADRLVSGHEPGASTGLGRTLRRVRQQGPPTAACS